MKYAKWVLNFNDPQHGTGPEEKIVLQGFSASAAFSNGDITDGGEILGYFTGEPTGLEKWQFTELTEQQALDFVLAFDETATVGEDGRIEVVVEDLV